MQTPVWNPVPLLCGMATSRLFLLANSQPEQDAADQHNHADDFVA